MLDQVTSPGARFQIGKLPADGKSLRATAHIQAGHFQKRARAELKLSLRLIASQSLEFDPAAISQGPPAAFFQPDQDGFLCFRALGVLGRNLHLVEYSEVVKFPLGFVDITLPQRFAGLKRNEAANNFLSS